MEVAKMKSLVPLLVLAMLASLLPALVLAAAPARATTGEVTKERTEGGQAEDRPVLP